MRALLPLLLLPVAALAGSLDPDVIQAVILKNKGTIRACYERELAKKPDLSGKVLVRFTIQPDGTVSDAGIAESTLHDAATESCVVERFGKLRFPRPSDGGTVSARFPLLFGVKGD